MNRSAAAQSPTQFLVSRGAVLDDVSGIPLHFGDTPLELEAFSGSAALVCGLGSALLLHEGPDALDLLHRLSTNDLLQLEPGRSVLTVLTSERGRVIDVLNVAHIESDRLLLLSDSPSAVAAAEWIDRFTIIENAVVSDVSADVARYAVIGPDASNIVRSAFGVDLAMGDVVSPDEAPTGGSIEKTVLVASNWGGLPRVDVVMPALDAEATWDRLAEAGAVPAGDQAFHTRRVSLVVPFPGTELTADVNPLEAGLKNLISFTKGCYVGQEVVARLDTYDKVQRSLVALTGDGELSAGAELRSGDKRAGVVTYASPLEISGVRHALGYVRRDYLEEGTQLVSGGSIVTVLGVPEASSLR